MPPLTRSRCSTSEPRHKPALIAALILVGAAAVVLALDQRAAGALPAPPARAVAIVRRLAEVQSEAQEAAAPARVRASVTRYVSLASRHPEALGMTASGASAAVDWITTQSAIARFTQRSSGFAWNAGTAAVSGIRTASEGPLAAVVVATLTELWQQAPGDAASTAGGSGASDPFRFSFFRSSTGWRLTDVEHLGVP